MGCRTGEGDSDAETPTSSLSEALLFATFCIIDLPVDVHLIDGSVYSGIFHTACVENDYGVVLKNARMTRKGKRSANVANGHVIDTLVILSGDLVQVVSKGVQLPACGFDGNMAGDDMEAIGTVSSTEQPDIEAKKSRKSTTKESQINQTRQVGDGQLQGEPEDYRLKFELQGGETGSGFEGSSSKRDAQNTQINLVEKRNEKRTSKQLLNGVHAERPTSGNTSVDAVSLDVSTSSNAAVDVNLETCNSSMATTKNVLPSDSNKIPKEFKLNPGAKIFSPSIANLISTTPPLPIAANVAYAPNYSPVLPVAVARPEVGFGAFASRSSVPAKFVPYGALTTGNDGSGSQFSQPMVEHVGTRTPPLKYAVPYHPVQTAPAYMLPNSQSLGGRRISSDLVQGSPIYSRPLLTSQQAQFSKHQASFLAYAGSEATHELQLCVPPTFMVGPHPHSVPNTIALFQHPLAGHHPVQVPGSNDLFSTKF